MGDVVTLRLAPSAHDAACEAYHDALLRRAEAAVHRAWADIAQEPPESRSAFAITFVGTLLGSLACQSTGDGDFIETATAFGRRYAAAVGASR